MSGQSLDDVPHPGNSEFPKDVDVMANKRFAIQHNREKMDWEPGQKICARQLQQLTQRPASVGNRLRVRRAPVEAAAQQRLSV
jgi:hypothetical protein